MSIQHIFCPRALAVVGSTAQGKIAYELIRQIVDGGFRQVCAINPKRQGVFGVPAYEAVSEIDGAVDLVVVASPAATVPGVLEDAGRAGVGAAVVITAGFSEVGNRDGETEIKQVAGRYGMRLVGPNCAGVINTHHRLFASLETRPPAGEVAFISQSGAMGGAVLSWAEEQGLGFSKFLSYGNRADVDEIELLPFLAEDPETKVVALYIESVVDGRAFLSAIREFTRRKPLVVIKAGRSQAGLRATLSHTGSMAGSDEVYDAALRDSGALRVDTVEEMFDLCKGLVHLPPFGGAGPRDGVQSKPRLAIVTNSGGPGVMAADRAEQLGTSVCEPGTELKDRLGKFLPSYCSLRNPFDLTVEGTEADYRETLCAVLGEYDAAVAIDVAPPYLDSVSLARGVCDAAAKSGKPVAASFMAGRVVADAIAYLKSRGLPNYPVAERAVAVLAHMAEYAAFRSSARTWPAPPEERKPLPSAGQMLEPDAVQWLCENGIPTLPFRFARTVTEAVQGCREIGYPVAMKVVSPQISHKTEWGGVRLDIADDAGAAEAFMDIKESAAGRAKENAAAGYPPDFRGVIVYPMVKDTREILLGASRDPQFGPVVALGMGGTLTELLRDVSLRVAPVDRAQAKAMIGELRSFPLLTGYRGDKPRDLNALAEVLVTLSRLPFVYPEIAEIDLNPVFLLPKGLVVGDVRVIRKEQTKP